MSSASERESASLTQNKIKKKTIFENHWKNRHRCQLFPSSTKVDQFVKIRSNKVIKKNQYLVHIIKLELDETKLCDFCTPFLELIGI